MKLAISNLAWPKELDSVVLKELKGLGVSGLEVAPTRVFSSWGEINEGATLKFRDEIEALGLEIVSLQSITYGLEGLSLFEDDGGKLVSQLESVAKITKELGAKKAVFGVPSLRKKGELTEEELYKKASEKLKRVADHFLEHGVHFCFEPLPKEYGCEFVNSLKEGAKLVQLVSNPAFKLNIDVAALSFEEALTLESLQSLGDAIGHIHITQPHLGDFSQPEAYHSEFAKVLKELNWFDYISIEMLPAENSRVVVKKAIQFLIETYF